MPGKDQEAADTVAAPSPDGYQSLRTGMSFAFDLHATSQAKRGRLSRRTIVDADVLLDAYARAAARLRSLDAVRVGVLWRSPVRGAAQFCDRLQAGGVASSVTGALAADLLAPYLTEIEPWEIYVDGRSPAELRQIARNIGLEQALGGRLILRPFPTPSKDALSARIDGMTVAAWPRVFSDLRPIGVRGEEAAEHLREQRGNTL